MDYISKPYSFPPNFKDRLDAERFAIVQKIFFTKFDHWKYETEIRVWAPLQNEENGVYYLEFDEKLQLVEVILGAQFEFSKNDVEEALGSLTSEVRILKARPAWDKFEMVEDEN